MPKPGWSEWLWIGVFTLVLAYLLLLPPIVGLADNGDFSRETCIAGLVIPPASSGHRGAYLTTHYVIEPAIRSFWLLSSDLVFVGAAVPLNRLFSKDGRFDLRAVGVLHGVGLLLAVALMLVGLARLQVLPRLLLGGLTVVIFSDVGYVAYCNSFYGETASLIFFLSMMGFTGVLVTASGPWRSRLFVGFLVATALFILAKAQNAPLGVPLALLAALWACRLFPIAHPFRRWGVGGAIGIGVTACLYLGCGRPAEMRDANHYNNVFYEILPHGASPRDDLRALGLDSALVALSGTRYWSPGVPTQDAWLRAAFFARITDRAIVRFYARHPRRFAGLLVRGAEAAIGVRLAYLGNFPRDAGYPPYAQSRAFSLWSDLKAQFVPRSCWLFAFLLLNVLVVAVKWRWVRGDWLRTQWHAAVLLMAVLAFLTVVVGEGGAEMPKHMFLVNVLCDTAVVVLVRDGLTLLMAMRAWRRLPGRDATRVASRAG